MNTALVVLDFKNRTVRRYLNRIRTSKAVMPDGFNADDKPQIEAFRVNPLAFQDSESIPAGDV